MRSTAITLIPSIACLGKFDFGIMARVKPSLAASRKRSWPRGAGGLGGEVLSSIQQLDVGLGFESGLCVVLLAIILDRITQSFGQHETPR